MTYICIGKRKGDHGRLIPCTNTSDTPSVPGRAEWGYLCAECMATQYGRPQIHVDVPDTDHPNVPELEAYELAGKSGMDESEAEELAGLRDLELDIDGLF